MKKTILSSILFLYASLTFASSKEAGVLNLRCTTYDKEQYTLSVVGEDIHLCGKGENALIRGDEETESNIRMIDDAFLKQKTESTYYFSFVAGLRNQPCARCHGDTVHVSSVQMYCDVVPQTKSLCVAQKQGPQPDLGKDYDKALKNGVGEDYWGKVPWVTLYDPKTSKFSIFVFEQDGKDLRIWAYTDVRYYRDFLKKDQFVSIYKSLLAQGYVIHNYSTNEQGKAFVKGFLQAQ
ncbi:MAG: hypothetical protein KUL82_01045 [Bdellovibrio sp.]|nr:hypothetical protein [Bdellovibrio sp.]